MKLSSDSFGTSAVAFARSVAAFCASPVGSSLGRSERTAIVEWDFQIIMQTSGFIGRLVERGKKGVTVPVRNRASGLFFGLFINTPSHKSDDSTVTEISLLSRWSAFATLRPSRH
jgi:hypothetical protein